MSNILVTGSHGQLGSEIKTIVESGKGFDPEWEKKDWW